jgi:hypothetical protein
LCRQAGEISESRRPAGPSWPSRGAPAERGAFAWWEALALGGRHLADDEPALSHLLANVLELLFTLFLLAELLWAWHVHSA